MDKSMTLRVYVHSVWAELVGRLERGAEVENLLTIVPALREAHLVVEAEAVPAPGLLILVVEVVEVVEVAIRRN